MPLPLVRAGLIALRSVFGEAVFATWEEAELMEVSMLSERGTADAEELGIEPKRMGDVLEDN
jgi:NADH dehydrogenase